MLVIEYMLPGAVSLGDAIHGGDDIEEHGAAENNTNDYSCRDFLEWKVVNFGPNPLLACSDGPFNGFGMLIFSGGTITSPCYGKRHSHNEFEIALFRSRTWMAMLATVNRSLLAPLPNTASWSSMQTFAKRISTIATKTSLWCTGSAKALPPLLMLLFFLISIRIFHSPNLGAFVTFDCRYIRV